MKFCLFGHACSRFSSLIVVMTAVSFSLAVPAMVRAQGVEIGTDAIVQTSIGSAPSVTMVAIPAAYMRLGFYPSSLVSLEPRVGLISAIGGGSKSTIYAASLSMLLHLSQSRTGIGPYLRPFAGMTGTAGDVSATQANAGVGLGVNLPITNSLATRLEANYAHAFSSNDFDSANAIGASIGLSYFIR